IQLPRAHGQLAVARAQLPHAHGQLAVARIQLPHAHAQLAVARAQLPRAHGQLVVVRIQLADAHVRLACARAWRPRFERSAACPPRTRVSLNRKPHTEWGGSSNQAPTRSSDVSIFNLRARSESAMARNSGADHLLSDTANPRMTIESRMTQSAETAVAGQTAQSALRRAAAATSGDDSVRAMILRVPRHSSTSARTSAADSQVKESGLRRCNLASIYPQRFVRCCRMDAMASSSRSWT